MTNTDAVSSHPGRLRTFTGDGDGESLSCARVDAVRTAAAPYTSPTVVLPHGAGTSDKTRLTGLMADFATRGRHALACDFAGHCDSSGTSKISACSAGSAKPVP